MKSGRTFTGILLSIIVLACACKKDLKSESLNSSSVDFSRRSTYANSWGVVISKTGTSIAESENLAGQYTLSPINKVQLAKTYGVQFYRAGIVKKDWDQNKTGFLFTYDQYKNNNLSVLLNLIWKDTKDEVTGIDSPQPFADDALNPNSEYYKWVKEVIDSLSKPTRQKPVVIVVENEENNSLYHIVETEADYLKYVNMVKAVIQICQPKGIPVTNGGITSKALQLTTHNWLKNSQRRLSEAQMFAWNAFMPSMYYTLYPPRPSGIFSEGNENLKFQVDQVMYFLNAYKTMSISCINFHWYEPAKARGWKDEKNNGLAWNNGVNKNHTSLNVLETSMEFMTTYNAPKKIITNEIGILTNSSCLLLELTTKIAARPYGSLDVACLFDGDGKQPYDAKGFHNTFPESTNPIFNLRPTGDMFSKIVKKQSTAGCISE